MKLRRQFTAALLTVAISRPIMAQDSGSAGLRERTDANAERDLQSNLAYLREQAALRARAEEASKSVTSSANAAVAQPVTARQSKIAPPSPPTYSGGSNAIATARAAKNLSPSYSWVPKDPQIDGTDLEAMQRPSLRAEGSEESQVVSGRLEETSQQIRLANYQDATNPPSLPFNPNGGFPTPNGGFASPAPNGGFASPGLSSQMNTQNNSVLPPSSNLANPSTPGSFGAIGTNPTTIVPNVANPANLPQYPQPQQRPAFVNTQPFVSGPPCEFDAYDMVMPASYAQSQPCATPYALPYSPSTTTMGEAYVPPTITPNYAPGLYSSSNAGFRPLFSLGQENYNAQLGRGIIGQPTAYVPGQPFRNFFRYLSP